MPNSIESALHGARSSLAGVLAEVELLEIDGVDVARLRQLLEMALFRIGAGQQLLPDLSPARDRSRSRVVLLEDDERVGSALLRRLDRAGYPSCLVLNVDSAVAWADSGALLVADLSALEDATPAQILPLRTARPIVLTGASAHDGRRRAQIFSPATVLSKPLNFALLEASLNGHPASESK